MTTEQPIKEIKPVVVPAQFFVVAPLAGGFFSMFPAMFVFIISNIISGVFGDGFDPVFVYGAATYGISFAVVVLLVYAKMFNEPKRTVYRIFANKLEYYEGFFNRQRRTLIFDQVIDVQLVEGVLQQTKGVGTVMVVTQQLVASGQAQLSNRTIKLTNIPEPEANYELIRDLATNKNEEQAGSAAQSGE